MPYQSREYIKKKSSDYNCTLHICVCQLIVSFITINMMWSTSQFGTSGVLLERDNYLSLMDMIGTCHKFQGASLQSCSWAILRLSMPSPDRWGIAPFRTKLPGFPRKKTASGFSNVSKKYPVVSTRIRRVVSRMFLLAPAST